MKTLTLVMALIVGLFVTVGYSDWGRLHHGGYRMMDSDHHMMYDSGHGPGQCWGETSDRKLDVKETKKGVTIDITSEDKSEIDRIKEMGRMMMKYHK